MDRIFLSYRRDDTAGYAGRLADALRDNLGDEVVFRDVDTIGPGIDFVQAITSAVENTSVLLAVIGRRWLTAKDSARRRRIDDPDDYVRLEITLALELGRKVIPILVDGARFPEPQDVPEPLRPLLRHNAIELSDTRWDYDVSVLLDELRPASLPIEEPAAPVEKERGRATLPRRRIRLGVLGLVGLVLVAGLVTNVMQGRSGSASPESPVTTETAPAPAPSSVPDTTTTLPVTTSVTRATPRPTVLPSSPLPTQPPRTTTPPTTVPPPPTTTVPTPPSYPYEKRSTDGAFGAYKTADGNHYIVRKVATGELVLTTRPRYVGDPNDANNDVKAAMFCPGSNVVLATYHYSAGTSIESWIGYWSTASGAFVRSQVARGEVYALEGFCSG